MSTCRRRALAAGIALCLLALPAIAQRQVLVGPRPAVATAPAPATTDPSFRLVNRDLSAVHRIYVTPAAQRGWGADRLGQDVLISGRIARIGLPAGQCVNDIRVVFADGRTQDRRRVNTCETSSLVFP